MTTKTLKKDKPITKGERFLKDVDTIRSVRALASVQANLTFTGDVKVDRVDFARIANVLSQAEELKRDFQHVMDFVNFLPEEVKHELISYLSFMQDIEKL